MACAYVHVMNSHLNAVSAYLYMAVTTCRSYFEAVVNDMMNSSGSVTSSVKERVASALRNCIAGSECGDRIRILILSLCRGMSCFYIF